MPRVYGRRDSRGAGASSVPPPAATTEICEEDVIQLHVLGTTEDGQLLLAAHPEAESAGYRVAIDDRVAEMLDLTDRVAVAPAPEEPEPEPEPEPEIRLPEGPLDVSSPAEALEAAHGLWLVEQERGASDLPLHDAVLANLNKWNVRVDSEILDEGWWVTKLGDRAWQISFRFLSRGRIHEAEWVLDTEDARLTPENHFAAILAWWKPEAPKKAAQRRRRRRRSRGGSGGGQRSGQRRN